MSDRYHEFIRTEHVFIDGERLYLKKEAYDQQLMTEGIVQWFPVDFTGITRT